MTTMRRLAAIAVGLVLMVAPCLGAGTVWAQAAVVEEERVELGVSCDTAKLYPSLTPRSYLKIDFEDLRRRTTAVAGQDVPVYKVVQRLDGAGDSSTRRSHELDLVRRTGRSSRPTDMSGPAMRLETNRVQSFHFSLGRRSL